MCRLHVYLEFLFVQAQVHHITGKADTITMSLSLTLSFSLDPVIYTCIY